MAFLLKQFTAQRMRLQPARRQGQMQGIIVRLKPDRRQGIIATTGGEDDRQPQQTAHPFRQARRQGVLLGQQRQIDAAALVLQ